MAVGEAGDVEFFEGGGGYVEVTRLERRGRGGGWYGASCRLAEGVGKHRGLSARLRKKTLGGRWVGCWLDGWLEDVRIGRRR